MARLRKRYLVATMADGYVKRIGPTADPLTHYWRIVAQLENGRTEVFWGHTRSLAEARKLNRVAQEFADVYTAPMRLVRSGAAEPEEADSDSESDSEEAAPIFADDAITLPTQLLDVVLAAGRKGQKIQRYKGLGEMNAEQLWETTLDPDNRALLQVKVEDADVTDEIFTRLMGDVVEPRREFIQDNALNVANLDV